MALDLTTAIAPDLAGRVLASILVSLVSIAMCAGGMAALLARSRRPNIPVAARVPSSDPVRRLEDKLLGESRASTIRGGACQRARIIAPQPCIRQVRRGLTMMQSCASAAKLRGGGPILRNGVNTMVGFG